MKAPDAEASKLAGEPTLYELSTEGRRVADAGRSPRVDQATQFTSGCDKMAVQQFIRVGVRHVALLPFVPSGSL